MAGPKQSSSLPARKSKTKAAKTATEPKPSLSSEFVIDSDDSQDIESAREEKSASKTASSRSNPAKPAGRQPSTSQGKPSKKRKLPSSSPEKDDSGGSGSGNDSSSEDEERPSKKRILAAHNESPTPMPKPATARPVLAKPSIKSSFNIKPLHQNKGHGPGALGKESDNEAGESSEDSGSGSESGSGNESVSGSSDKTSLQSPEKESPVRKSVPQQSVLTFEPPAGFEPTSISLHPASKLSDILAPSNLQGKQIWHITAPESIPISLVKKVPIQNIGNGASVLEHHGAKYGLVPESDVEQCSSRALLLPSTQNNNYRLSKTNIIKTLHLQQLVSLPSHAPEPAVHPNHSASASDSYKKTPHPQPEGLRMRYHPFGASDDSDLGSTPEPMPKAPEFRIPAAVKENSPGRKRKRLESNNGSSNVVSAIKSKKRKQSPQATAGAIEDPKDIDAIPDVRSDRVESPAKIPHPETNGLRPKGDLPNGNEMKEARRKRKERKRLEKRESPSKSAIALPLDMKQDAETIQPGEVVEGVPAMANAVEGTRSINGIPSPQKEPKDAKAKRKEERRRRKEMEKGGASLNPAEDAMSQEPDGGQAQMLREIENAQRDASVLIPSPVGDKKSPLDEEPRSAHVSPDLTSNLNRDSQTQRKMETKKKREEKRRRRMESRDNA